MFVCPSFPLKWSKVFLAVFLRIYSHSLTSYCDHFRWGVFRARLFRDSCVFHRGNYVKDLNSLGRDLRRVVIVDNSPASYIFHPDNAVSISCIHYVNNGACSERESLSLCNIIFSGAVQSTCDTTLNI